MSPNSPCTLNAKETCLNTTQLGQIRPSRRIRSLDVRYFLSFFRLGRMGNNKQALQLIIQEEDDVEKASLTKTCVISSVLLELSHCQCMNDIIFID